jgi:catalase-peroxidase
MTTAIAGLLTISFPVTAMAEPGMVQNEAKSNQFWWPEQLNLGALRDHDKESNPFGNNFDYVAEFKTLDLDAVKKDIDAVLTNSQDWWPADYGNYGPLFIRMAWHSAGTYRTHDGRGGAGGGQQRFDPLNSWPDNGNLDKARRLLWPVKQKYGTKISWADLIVLTGNVAMENMGFKTLGFAGGRADDWEPDFVYWGPETKMLDSNRRDKKGDLKGPVAAIHMGLIYVNPEGPNGNHDPLAAAKDIRESFGRMAMNDEEIVALIAGGHTFGKAHGAHKPQDCLGAEPGAAPIEDQGFGWKNKCGKGHSEDTVTSGLEGAWTSEPALWTTMFFDNLLSFEWKKVKSPAGATQWIPTDDFARGLVRDAHLKDVHHAPIMLTTDMTLKLDPEFRKISERFHKSHEEFEQAFASAWFKLTHRDMGPRTRYIGTDVPDLEFIWQDPIPAVDHKLISDIDAEKLKSEILKTGLSVSELVKTAWASASSFRGSDMRGGANGGRVRLEPQKNWKANNPKELAKTLAVLEKVNVNFNAKLTEGKKVSFADTVVLAGAAAIEKAAKDAGHAGVKVPFKAGRMDASQEKTSVSSFSFLEPTADGFRNYYSKESYKSPAEMLVDQADLLNLTVPEMTVLVGGMRSLNANAYGTKHGVFTDKPETLNNDFFVNLLDMSTAWQKSSEAGVYEGRDRKTGDLKWTATPVDLVFGSNTELRAVAEAYAFDSSKDKFVNDFVDAWTKVMILDRL